MIQVGACVWNFNAGPYCAPYENAITRVGKLGFSGAELMIFSEEDIEVYYTKNKVRELSMLLTDNGLVVPQVSIYDNALHDLASFERDKQDKAVDNFRRCLDIALGLESKIVNTVSQWPIDLAAPIPYPPLMIYTDLRGMTQLDPKLSLSLPRNWSWEKAWDNYVEVFRRCLDHAEAHGVYFAIEGHCHVLVSGADSMLRFLDHLDGHPNLAFNLDTGWHMRQREYLPMTIYKLADRLRNIHVRDTDGLLNYSLPVGQGITDWKHVIDALRDVNFNGFMNIEMANLRDPDGVFSESKRALESILANT